MPDLLLNYYSKLMLSSWRLFSLQASTQLCVVSVENQGFICWGVGGGGEHWDFPPPPDRVTPHEIFFNGWQLQYGQAWKVPTV